MIEISGRESKIEAFIERMRHYNITALVRTGRIAMVRSGGRSVAERKAETAARSGPIKPYVDPKAAS